jgi:molybdopterin synthase catalytic subunit
MAISFWEVSITSNRLEFPPHAFNLHSGAVIDFWGIVRAMEDDREIKGIDYEVHQPMAEHQMNLLAEKARSEFCLTSLILCHRIGFVSAGEASLFLRVAASHRSAAFSGSQWLIQELKQKVPIWKRPVFKEKKSAVDKKKVEEAAPV